MSVSPQRGNDLAIVLNSANCIRLLVKQLFSFAKIQQFVGYTKKSMFFNDRGRQRLFKSFQKAVMLLYLKPWQKDGKSQKEITLRYETNLSRLQK